MRHVCCHLCPQLTRGTNHFRSYVEGARTPKLAHLPASTSFWLHQTSLEGNPRTIAHSFISILHTNRRNGYYLALSRPCDFKKFISRYRERNATSWSFVLWKQGERRVRGLWRPWRIESWLPSLPQKTRSLFFFYAAQADKAYSFVSHLPWVYHAA